MPDEATRTVEAAETTTKPVVKKAPKTKRPKARLLPPYKVILHNDDKNTFEHVIITITTLTPLSQQDALRRAVEAHVTGCALLLMTHRERAELFVEQFQSASLTVTVEPDE